MTKRECIAKWKWCDYTLRLYDTEKGGAWFVGDCWVKRSQYRLAYKFTKGRKVLFEGEDYGCSPGIAIDSQGALIGLLAFLTLKPGDTDREYFEDYTDEQLAFANSGDAQEIAMDVIEYEEGQRAR